MHTEEPRQLALRQLSRDRTVRRQHVLLDQLFGFTLNFARQTDYLVVLFITQYPDLRHRQLKKLFTLLALLAP